MKYRFSEEFLKILPPDNSFGDAWESLCYDLLSEEHGIKCLQRFNAPDGGIDILNRKKEITAIQCKSHKYGANGTISPNESIKYLKSAITSRKEIPWKSYVFATNADYSGVGVKKILSTANSHSLGNDVIEFWGPRYWCELCDRHFDKVAHRLDCRVTVTESEVIEAFRKARYYDKYVDDYAKKISTGKWVMVVKNNRTPVELEFPFSPDLTVENCVDAVQQLLGIRLKWTNFSDIGTSAGPEISLVVDRKKQAFNKTIREVQDNNPDKDFECWITLVWKDEAESDRDSGDRMTKLISLEYDSNLHHQLSQADRKNKTLERAERLIQTMVWDSAAKIRNGTFVNQ